MSSSRTSGRSIWQIVENEHRMCESIHAKINELWNKGERSGKDIMQQLYMLIRDLSIHAHKEQILVYPLFDRLGDKGKQEYEQALKEHHSVEIQLKAIEELCMHHDSKGLSTQLDQQVLDLVNSLMADVSHHVNDEERNLIPELQKVIPDGSKEAVDLGRKWEALNARVATRPHPDAPVKGEACVAANIAQADLDKNVDEGRFGHIAPTEPGKPAAAMSDQLHPLEQGMFNKGNAAQEEAPPKEDVTMG